MAKVTHEFDLYGKHYVLETGELAKQATGAVLVKQGDSTVLVTAVVSKERKDYDFFPLTVDFIEKMYAVGRIPGGKGRSGQRRPLFQERLHFGTQIGRDIGIKTACDGGLAKMHGGILPKRSWTGRSIAPAADKDQQHRGSFPDRERQIWAEVR